MGTGHKLLNVGNITIMPFSFCIVFCIVVCFTRIWHESLSCSFLSEVLFHFSFYNHLIRPCFALYVLHVFNCDQSSLPKATTWLNISVCKLPMCFYKKVVLQQWLVYHKNCSFPSISNMSLFIYFLSYVSCLVLDPYRHSDSFLLR